MKEYIANQLKRNKSISIILSERPVYGWQIISACLGRTIKNALVHY